MDKVKKILEDLYKVDPELKIFENKLEAVAAKILAAQPETNFDKNFADKLKAELLVEAEKLKESKKSTSFIKKFNFIFMKKSIFIAAGAAALLLFAFIAVKINYLNYGPPKITQKLKIDFSQKITPVKSGAFGRLAFNQGAAPENFYAGEEAALSGSNSGLAKSEATMDAARTIGMGGGGVVSKESSSSIVAPYMPSFYKFVYKGEDFSVPAEEAAVLKRVKGGQAGSRLASLINEINVGIVDLNKFTNLKMQNFSFVEDRDFGYAVNIDMAEEAIYINENWNRWAILAGVNKCRDEKCFQPRQPLTVSDVPDDQVLINVANQFARDYGISVGDYGAPEVESGWKKYYNPAIDAREFYVPEIISVIYPLKVGGQVVYSEWGMPEGLRVSVNIKEKKTQSVYGLTSRNYESSMYKTETDVKKIIDVAQNGGLYKRYYYMEGLEPKEIGLGTPSVIYMKMWNYDSGKNEELFAPAFLFPILDVPADTQIYENYVVVPFIKDILESRGERNDYPVLMEGSGGIAGGAAGAETEEIKAEEVKKAPIRNGF